MEKWLYVMQIVKTKTYNRLNKEGVTRHVDNLKNLDENGSLALCGVYKGYPGHAGMLVLKAESLEEAKAICEAEPLVAGGYATYELHAIQVANKENNFLL